MSDTNNEKEWTIMIYLAGDNNLSDEMIWALKELYRVGAGDCHVVAQFDPSAKGIGPRRYNLDRLEGLASTSCDLDGILELDLLREAVDTNSLQEIGSAEDSANPIVLGGFLSWALRNMKAKHYMLILSGHGSGAIGGLLEDRNPYGRLTLPSLGRALSAACHYLHGKKINILGLDSCTMSMVEVAHEVRDTVDYLVGAEGFVQNAGWPYHRLLESLRRAPDPPELAKEIVKNYFNYYSDYLAAGVSAEQAVVHIGAAQWEDYLIDNIRKLANSLRWQLDRDNSDVVKNALVLAHWDAQSFNNEQNIDLYDFCERLMFYLPQNMCRQIHSCCESILKVWDHIVPLSTHTGPRYQFAHGLSIYFPWAEVAVEYDNLHFSKKTGWFAFLKQYVDKTCRKPRDDEQRGKDGELPQCIHPACDGNFAGIDGRPAHRAGGWSGVKGGGWAGAKGGGWSGAKYGSLSPEDLVLLSCMKNFPVGFYQPRPPSLGEVKNMIAKRNMENLGYGIRSCPDSTLQSVIRKLPKTKKECIAKALKTAK